ncbi:MAG: carbon-nitrogen hydrolase family protein [Gemmataceae bacterium]
MTWKLAGVQMDVILGDVEGNLQRIRQRCEQAAQAGARLVLFPECATSGYCFASLAEARPHALRADAPQWQTLSRPDLYSVIGFLERDGERLYNSAALVGPSGVEAVYRKVHLPHIGLDRFVTPGDRPFAVQEVQGVRIGMHICYDGSFPEAPRVLMLLGADLLLLPTNWPMSAKMVVPLCLARAVENHVYYAAINRIGSEGGYSFIGQSQILAPTGEVLAQAGGTEETILYATIDPSVARNKKLVRIAGQHHIDRIADRRPEMYRLISEPAKHPPN